jgi:hypothetical protein
MPDIVPLPADCAAWLAELKARIHAAQPWSIPCQRRIFAIRE